MPTFYAPQSQAFRGFDLGSVLANAQRYRAGEEALRRSQAEEAQAAQLRPLELVGQRLALEQAKSAFRGQILGAVETPEDYKAALGEIERLGLPTGDLPAYQADYQPESQGWMNFRKPAEAPRVESGWLQSAFPALPAPERPFVPQANPVRMMDMGEVQRRAQVGLPLQEQTRMKATDAKIAAQADELERRKAKDQYLRDYAEKNFELRRAGLDAATADRETRLHLARLGYGLDVERFNLTKKESERSAALGPKFTADQSNSAIYGRRIEQAIGDIDRVTSSGYNPSGFFESAKLKALVTGAPGAELVASPEEKQLAQAYRNAINAILRRESGAAIGASEFTTAQQQYFASVNDDPETLAQKRRNLTQAMTGMQTAAGGAWDATPLVGGQGVKAPSPSTPNLPTISSQAAYDALPPGTKYKGPDGRIFTKKAR